MIVFTSTLALLCNWISVSVSEFHTVEVQPGEEVILICSNFSRMPGHIYWFKLVNEHNASCISSMLSSDSNATLHDGYNISKSFMTSNNTNIFLNIKQLEFSDSGLYFCGYTKDGHPVIFGATYLQVQDVVNGLASVLNVVFACLTVFLLMVVIGLVFRIRAFHTAQTERQSPQHSQNLDSDALNYTALSFPLKANRTRTSALETEMEPHVVYAATR
ncbi:uncharacterized protein LOC121639308 [Melanotaenia boesemani]|uniref:uncharacterized protein LOC121639308 n=1 Tax=Melanotaenia boesemani TaxID=1250792 RepID=UPI001C05C621|nr:uncharacterized protein LOC121639308 [Melanotaenia boesemani]